MHINEVERILRDSVSGQENRYEIKRYCDHICCESDFVLLRDGLEYAYLKFDAAGQMSMMCLTYLAGKCPSVHSLQICSVRTDFMVWAIFH